MKQHTDDLSDASSGEVREEGVGVEPVTIFMCGPSKCEHDYSGEWVELERGGSAKCAKCGVLAINEAYWSDF